MGSEKVFEARKGGAPARRQTRHAVVEPVGSLFVGNPRGGGTATILVSLTPNCRRYEGDRQLYLTQPPVNLPTWPARDLDAGLRDQSKLRQAARFVPLNPPQNQLAPDNTSSPTPR